MEWVEITGNTIEEAKEAALDELGVDEADAEFEVLQQPKTGLFGRVRTEARIRARVRPTAPRAKDERRNRRRRSERDTAESGAESPASGAPASASGASRSEAPADATPGRARRRRGGGRPAAAQDGSEGPAGGGVGTVERDEQTDGASGAGGASGSADGVGSGSSPRRRGRGGAGGGREAGATSEDRGRRSSTSKSNDRAGEGPTVEVPLEEQARIAEEFLHGLVAQFGLRADISIQQPDEDNVNLAISGQDLGLLIGPKGATLLAIQDLTRTVVQRKTSAGNGRIHVDVGGYREKRAVALANFARQQASHVVETGSRRALEPMSAADRKIVHDTLNEVDGVETISEGEDPRRRVVIIPTADTPATAAPAAPAD